MRSIAVIRSYFQGIGIQGTLTREPPEYELHLKFIVFWQELSAITVQMCLEKWHLTDEYSVYIYSRIRKIWEIYFKFCLLLSGPVRDRSNWLWILTFHTVLAHLRQWFITMFTSNLMSYSRTGWRAERRVRSLHAPALFRLRTADINPLPCAVLKASL